MLDEEELGGEEDSNSEQDKDGKCAIIEMIYSRPLLTWIALQQ